MQGLIRSVMALAVVLLSVSASRSETYPTKPVTIVVALAAGGVADVIARAVGQRLTEEWGQPVVVENRGAANTQVGATYVAKSAPDGYTLLLAAVSFWVGPLLQKAPYDSVKDFSPISMVGRSPLVLVVNPSLPVISVKELIALAKAKPGGLNYASGTGGGSPQLAGELFKSLAQSSRGVGTAR